jgi:hypothetical protein
MNEIVLLGGADGDLIELYNGFEDRSLGTGGDFDAAFVKAVICWRGILRSAGDTAENSAACSCLTGISEFFTR